MVNWKKHFNDGRKLQKWLVLLKNGWSSRILPAKVCAHGYSIPMWEGHIMSNDLMMILEVMKEQSLFSLDSESRLHILRWPKTTTQRLKLPTEWEVSWSLPLANQWTSSMNFIHAVDGTEAARGNSVNEEIDRDCIFSEGRGSPQRL